MPKDGAPSDINVLHFDIKYLYANMYVVAMHFCNDNKSKCLTTFSLQTKHELKVNKIYNSQKQSFFAQYLYLNLMRSYIGYRAM